MTGKAALQGAALAYVAPWIMWVAFLPLALVFSLMAMHSTPAACFVAASIALGGGYLIWQVWGAYEKRGDQRLQIHAGVTTALALGWLFCATAFGMFHRPAVDVWPEIWRIFEYALKSFTLPIWFPWIVFMALSSITWNAFRASKPRDEKSEDEGKTKQSELDKALDDATIHVEAIVGDDDAKVIKGKIKGVPGKHVGAEMAGLAAKVDSQQGLRPGATRIVGDPTKASDAQITVMPVDPHKKVKPWPGPSAPGAWISEKPVPFGPYTDGEPAAMWMTGDEETSRPNQHVAAAGMTNAGKSAFGKMVWADGLTRRGYELIAADISGKIWQTFGPLMPYITKIAGLNGTSDEDIANNVLDAKELLDWVKRDAMDRQQRWGKLGITQWEPRCFEEFGDAHRDVVLEEAPNLLAEMADDVVDLARLLRSAGYRLWITAQRFDWQSMGGSTTLRSQLSAVVCFGMQDSRDATMILPEDVQESLARGSVMNTPGGWQNNTPGKCIAAIGGMSPERRSDPVRTWYAKDAVIAEHLAEYRERLWSVQQIEDMKNGIFPDGILVRTQSGNVQSDDVRTERGNVRTNVQKEEFAVYMDPELSDVHADPDEPVRMKPGTQEALGDLDASDFEPGDVRTSTEEFRRIVQMHLTSLLAQGLTECAPADVLKMQPQTGRSRQEIRNELIRLAEKAAATEVSTIPPDHPTRSAGKPGVYKLVAPREVPQELVMNGA
jgi:hypothetical protein